MLQDRPKGDKEPFDYSILIVCEDSKSSVYYFQEKVKKCGIYNTLELEEAILNGHQVTEGVIDVDGGSGSSPTSVVKYAIRKRDEYNAQAIKKGLFPYKKVYCILDVDDHNENDSNLDKAIEIIETDKTLLQKDGLSGELIPIISNVCFELWYVLHFIDYSTKALYRALKGEQKHDNQRLDRILESYLGEEYAKGDAGILKRIQRAKGNEKKALAHAKKLLDFHIKNLGLEGDERPYYGNPSTKVHQVVELLNSLKERHDANKAEDFRQIRLEDVLWKVSRSSTTNTQLLLSDSSKAFPNKILELINTFYPQETFWGKIDLFLDIFENPWGNTPGTEFYEEIGAFIWTEYPNWKKSIEE